MTGSTTPRLIGLDWGSTGLRAYLIGADGALHGERSAAGLGASTLAGEAAFVAALAQVRGPWDAALPVLACGMVGARHGWREAPYADCPAGAAELAARTVQVPGGPRIVPGLQCEDRAGVPDVMRGEETQILGALQRHPELADAACLILPGTHSKWAGVECGRVTSFATHMTGELYALLRHRSVLARLMPADDAGGVAGAGGAATAVGAIAAAPTAGTSAAAPAVAGPIAAASGPGAFEAGVDAARDAGAAGLAHQLFAVRTLGLSGRRDAAELPDYLSGLLIGHELRAGLERRAAGRLVVVAEPALGARYARALARFGVTNPLLLANTAPEGLVRLARSLELLT